MLRSQLSKTTNARCLGGAKPIERVKLAARQSSLSSATHPNSKTTIVERIAFGRDDDETYKSAAGVAYLVEYPDAFRVL